MGLNLEEFHKMLDGLSKAHSYFEDLLTDYEIEPVEPLTIHDNITMACYMWYSQASHYCNTAVPYPFGPGVDPNGNLESLAKNVYIHMEENFVQYLQKEVDEDKSVKYVCLQSQEKAFICLFHFQIFQHWSN